MGSRRAGLTGGKTKIFKTLKKPSRKSENLPTRYAETGRKDKIFKKSKKSFRLPELTSAYQKCVKSKPPWRLNLPLCTKYHNCLFVKKQLLAPHFFFFFI